jgi:hypothetical protein
MGPASDSVDLFEESDFGITDLDVDCCAHTAASYSDTVATVSDSVSLPQHLILLLFFSFRFRCPYQIIHFCYCCPLPLISGSYYVFRTKVFIFILSPHILIKLQYLILIVLS